MYALDTGSGRAIAYRARERFPMCSTFKLLLAGAVLARVDAHNEDLGRVVGYGDADMLASETGAARLRAGLPAAWRVGDKTGTGDHGTANDVAIVWPPQRSPIVIAAYLTGSTVAAAAQNAALADVGRIVYQRLR